MQARCREDSPNWGENGMSDEQVARFYEALDYCEKNIKNFQKFHPVEQSADILMHMVRIRHRPPMSEFFERVKRIDELLKIEREQKELFRAMGRETIL